MTTQDLKNKVEDGNNVNDVKEMIEWEFISLKGHYAYWAIKSNKSDFEKKEMTANINTMWLKKGENPNKTTDWLRKKDS